ncbi:hypothetical protein DFAR_3460052 [Desulfarculales bacterium]
MYESLDKPALKPLPATAYQYARWKKARSTSITRGDEPPLLLGPPINWWARSWTSATRSTR